MRAQRHFLNVLNFWLGESKYPTPPSSCTPLLRLYPPREVGGVQLGGPLNLKTSVIFFLRLYPPRKVGGGGTAWGGVQVEGPLGYSL